MRSGLQQNGDELPGTRAPAARFILVRFYGLKPLRSGWTAFHSIYVESSSLTEEAAARRR